MKKYTRLVLSGGGPKGLAMLGALDYIHEREDLDNIQEYWGTSVGSIISLLLLIGYTPFEAFHQFFILENFADPSMLDIRNILEESAFCPIEIFGNKVRHFIEKKLGPGVDPTFFDLYRDFGKKIHIIGSNIDTMRGECFDVDTHPFMKVVDAIEISCDLPYIFTRKKYGGQSYVDGGFINNYACNLADDGLNKCLGICVLGDNKVNNNDYVGWVYRLLSMPIMELYREKISHLSNKFTNIELVVDNISIIEMSPNRTKKIEVYSAGYQQARSTILDMEKAYQNSRARLEYKPGEQASGWEWDLDWDIDC